MKTRVDSALVSRGIAASREKAQALIMAGQIYIGEKKVLKASETVEDNQELILRGEVDALASRGGHKIERAITVFGADVTGVVAMDIGAAAGGLIAGIFQLKNYVVGGCPGFLSLLFFLPADGSMGNMIVALVSGIVTVVVAFIACTVILKKAYREDV